MGLLAFLASLQWPNKRFLSERSCNIRGLHWSLPVDIMDHSDHSFLKAPFAPFRDRNPRWDRLVASPSVGLYMFYYACLPISQRPQFHTRATVALFHLCLLVQGISNPIHLKPDRLQSSLSQYHVSVNSIIFHPDAKNKSTASSTQQELDKLFKSSCTEQILSECNQ